MQRVDARSRAETRETKRRGLFPLTRLARLARKSTSPRWGEVKDGRLIPQPRLLQKRQRFVAKARHAFDPARPGEQNAVEAGFL